MKKLTLLATLSLLCLVPGVSSAQWVQEEDQYDKDYEACSEAAEQKADPLPEDQREDTFVRLFHECMKEKGHDVNLNGEAEEMPPAENGEAPEVGEGVEE